jgi:hypothetical protein
MAAAMLACRRCCWACQNSCGCLRFYSCVLVQVGKFLAKYSQMEMFPVKLQVC